MVSRRQFIGLCSMIGAAGATRIGFSGTGQASVAPDMDAGFRSLYQSLTSAQRNTICKPWDDPSRQLVNTGACVMTAPVDHVLSLKQRQTVTQLFRNMCSQQGFERQQYPAGFESGMLGSAEIVLYGTPDDSEYQVSLNGAHLMIRGGRVSGNEDVFGGPIAYGSQLGNGFARIPGNPFKYQTELANNLLLSLTDEQFKRATPAESAFEMDVSFRPNDEHQGVRASTFSDKQLDGLSTLIDSLLQNYDTERQQLAKSVIESNGGLSALSVAWFADKAYARDDSERDFYPVWRVEGPGLTWHFQGSPHVHAYLNLSANQGARTIGGIVGEVKRTVPPPITRRWLAQAFAGITDSQYGYHAQTLAAQLYEGQVTEGDLYSFLPFRNRLVVATIKASAMAEDLRQQLEGAGYVDDGKPVNVATLDYYAGREDLFGKPEKVEVVTEIPPRKELVEYVNRAGLPA